MKGKPGVNRSGLHRKALGELQIAFANFNRNSSPRSTGKFALGNPKPLECDSCASNHKLPMQRHQPSKTSANKTPHPLQTVIQATHVITSTSRAFQNPLLFTRKVAGWWYSTELFHVDRFFRYLLPKNGRGNAGPSNFHL